MTLVPGPLGTCQFLQLLLPSEQSLGLSYQPPPCWSQPLSKDWWLTPLIGIADPTRAGLGIWAQPAWLAVGKEVAGDSTRRTKQYPQAMVGLAAASATPALCFLGIYLLC